jgi:Mg-chelatase subunit ChlI
LLGQVVAAQFDLEAAIAELTRTGGSIADAQSQLQFLATVQRTVGTASPAALASMRAEIAATVNAAQAVAAQGRTAANADDKPDRAMIAAEARQAIADVGRDVFERRVLDPYLRFTSAEDEEAYRKREEQNREAYERELAKGTPEGD